MLDIIGIALISLFFIHGYRRGFVVAVFSFVALFLGILFCLKFSTTVSQYIQHQGWATGLWVPFVVYAFIFISVVFITRLLAKAIKSLVSFVLLGWFDGIAGGVLYAFIAALSWGTLLWLSDKMHLISATTIAKSITYTYFIKLAPWVYSKIGVVLPFAKQVWEEVSLFLESKL